MGDRTSDAELRELRAMVRGLLADTAGPERAVASLGTEPVRPATTWGAGLGLPGIGVPEELGGSGGGDADLAVVCEEAGRALSGEPYLSSVLAAATLLAGGTEPARTELLPAVAAGGLVAAVALGDDVRVTAEPVADGWTLSGVVPQMVDGTTAELLIVPAEVDGEGALFAVRGGRGVGRRSLATLDQTRAQARIELVHAPAQVVAPAGSGPEVLARTRDLAAVLLGAEGLGIAEWCLETAVEHARTRVQFGRPIGSFQAVQHSCADMLLDLEAARSVVAHAVDLTGERGGERGGPDPTFPAAASAVAAFVPGAVRRVVTRSIQVLGGLGITWDHPAHLFLKRAKASELLEGPTEDRYREFADREPERLFAGLAAVRATTGADGTADPVEADLARRIRHLLDTGPDPRAADDRPFLAAQFDAGLAWVAFPRGHGGLGLAAHHQEFVDRTLEAAGAHRANLRNTIGYGNVAPVLAVHGTDEQRRRHLRPCFTTAEIWCQLMSEPGAGSDVPGLATRARRDGDSWRISGQKIWTSFAHIARWGLAVVRTDPDVPKHQGLTCFVIDMTAPGVTVRPIRMLNGKADFNEVFLDDVVVDDADRVGGIGDGWRVVNSNLAAERAAFAAAGDEPLPGSVALAAWRKARHDGLPAAQDRLLRAVLASLAAYLTARRSHTDPDVHPAVVKILVTESTQEALESVLDLQGPAGSLCAPDEYAMERPSRVEIMRGDDAARYLRSRALTIEGGTSMVLRNVLAEKALRLPRDHRADLGVPWRDIPRSVSRAD